MNADTIAVIRKLWFNSPDMLEMCDEIERLQTELADTEERARWPKTLSENVDAIDATVDGENVILMRELIYQLARERDEARAELAAAREAFTVERVAEAMQMAWNEFTADTGNYPDVFKVERGIMWADFSRGNFAQMVTNWLPARVADTHPPQKDAT